MSHPWVLGRLRCKLAAAFVTIRQSESPAVMPQLKSTYAGAAIDWRQCLTSPPCPVVAPGAGMAMSTVTCLPPLHEISPSSLWWPTKSSCSDW